MKRRFHALVQVLAIALCVGIIPQAGAEDEQKGEASRMEKIRLRPQEGKMNCAAQVPLLGNQTFSLGIPETIGSSEGMILNFPEVVIKWNQPEESGAVGYRCVAEGKVDYSVRLVPDVDFVDVTMNIKNISAKQWTNVFSFNCLNPVNAPKFKDWHLERTYMSKNGKPFRMDGTTRINEGAKPFMRTLQFYLHEDYEEVSPFVRGFRSTSPDKTDGSYIVTLSEDGDAYMGATSPKALFLFNNLDRCCIHSATTFGDIAPGKETSVRVRLYLARGTLEDFLNRYYSDFPEAKPKAREKVELEGLPAPSRGGFGRLGFTIRAPWMEEGQFVLRAPETLQCSLGLLFIDHKREDMPPLFMLQPFPVWQKDKESGGVTYSYRAENDVQFGCSAVPGEDEVDVTYTVANHRDEDITNIAAQMCLVCTDAAGFGKKLDVSRTLVRVDGKWTPLSQTHPSPEEVGRPPWIHANTKASGPWRGERITKHGWWVTEELTDIGMIVMISEDGEHLVAMAWEGAPGTSSNSRIPCLHAGPPHAARCAPGKSVEFHGKIYLLPNDLEALDARYEKDFGKPPS